MIAPVSVCHHVSTIAALAADVQVIPHPRLRLIGSPTEPRRRSDERLILGNCSPHFMNVYGGRRGEKIETLCLHERSEAVLFRQSGRLADEDACRRPVTVTTYEWPVTHPVRRTQQTPSSLRSKTHSGLRSSR